VSALPKNEGDVVAGLREFMRPELQLMPGKYPTRPAPGHVANNLAVLACGQAPLGAMIHRLVRWSDQQSSSSETAEYPLVIPGFEEPELERQRACLQDTARVVLDPDGLVFPTEGSPAVVDWRLASKVGSDDSFAQGLWMSLSPQCRNDLGTRLNGLYSSEQHVDVVSRFAQILIRSSGSGVLAPEVRQVPELEVGTKFGEYCGPLLINAATATSSGQRLARIRQFGIVAYTFVVLGMLYEGSRYCGVDFVESPDGAHGPADALGVIVFTGETPGASDDPLVHVASQSLRRVTARCQTGVGLAVESKVRRLLPDLEEVPYGTGTLLVEAAMGKTPPEASPLRRFAAQLDSGSLAVTNSCVSVDIEELLPRKVLTKAIRTMGVKAGLVGPARGRGASRLMVEASLLSAIVTAVCGEESMNLRDFVAAVHSQLGLVLGVVELSSAQRRELEAIVAGIDDVDRVLQNLEELLKERLIRAGLAKRFSDGHTRVWPT
jgi:hypothetical protein